MSKKPTRDRCKEAVYAPGMFRSSQCAKYAVKEGYCAQHHPDAVKARQEKSMETYKAKQEAERSRYKAYGDALLREELAAAKADAERYRWLRMNRLWLKANLPMLAAPQLDAAIDAAIAKEKA
jgi:hypothetical protein